MKAPVWFLIARIDLTGGSSGYHRAELVDQFLTRIGEWWLVGTNAAGTWGYDMWDQQNQFVAVGITGGLVAFVCFVAMIACAWRLLGLARRKFDGTPSEAMYWLFGVALFVNVVAFFGANLYDQSKFEWFFLLASTSVVTSAALRSSAARASQSPLRAKAPSTSRPLPSYASPFWRRRPATAGVVGRQSRPLNIS